MTKQTNPGWPDPSDWSKRLHDKLEAIGQSYLSTPWDAADDPEAFEGLNLKQARAAEAVLATIAALHELPSFKGSAGTAVLHDLAGALRDVVFGGQPRLFTPARPGSRGTDGIDRNYLKVFVVWAVRFMIEAHGYSEGDSVKLVAGRFSKAGATGRKGGPLSVGTVQGWCDRVRADAISPQDVQINREVERHMAECRSDPAWPGTVADSMTWIDRLAADPLLASKYG